MQWLASISNQGLRDAGSAGFGLGLPSCFRISVPSLRAERHWLASSLPAFIATKAQSIQRADFSVTHAALRRVTKCNAS